MRIFNIDITRKGISPVVQVTEHDAMSRFFTLILRNGNADYEPPENPSYSVWYKTKDSTGWYDTITEPDNGTHPAVVASGNMFTIEIAEAATTSCGELALMITGDDGYQLTVTGIITQSADIPGYDGEEVENYYNVYITRMQENAARAENAAATAIEYGATVEVDETAQQLIITHTDNTEDVQTWVTEAEAWAVGQRDGVDVPSTDETYHNNAKYYAESVSGTVEAAEAAAESAAESAEQAAQSAASLTVDTELSSTSTNPVQNKVIDATVTELKNDLTAAENAIDAAQGEIETLKDTAYIVNTVEGDIAAFSDGAAADAKSVVIHVVPVQEGQGDPSPDNVRPISGRTGLTVTRAGKNLLYTDADQYNINGITIVKNADGTYTLNGTATAQVDAYLDNVDVAVPNGEYLYNGITGGSPQTYRIYLSVRKGNSTRYIGTHDGDASVTLTDETIRAFVRIFNGAVLRDVVIKPMLRPATITDDTYEPYTAQTYPITWETEAGAIYGGTLDVVSGVLTVTHVYWTKNTATMDNSENYPGWTKSGIKKIVGISSFFISGLWGNVGTVIGINTEGNNDIVYMPKGGYNEMTQTQWKALGIDVEFAVPLATPQTYQLTPTEVRTILGGNNIYTDAGAVSVEYVADTKLYIDNKVAELQALILEN